MIDGLNEENEMAWLWESWEEFVRDVEPVAIQRGRFQHARHATELDLLKDLLEAVRDFRAANEGLAALGFDGKSTKQTKDDTTLHKAHNLVIEAVYAGEALLLHHRRLALSDASYGFLHQHDIIEPWERYAGTTRIAVEIYQLTKDIDGLLEGYQRLVREDEQLLIDGLDLPEELTYDFRLARNVFSIGLDEVGLFLAGRGLEKVLRRIARDRKIAVVVRTKQKPAAEADFYDLIEALSRVSWKTRKVPLITKDTRALLHYLRELRNRGAHKEETVASVEGAREKATVIAKTAMQLWSRVDGNRARLDPTVILKDW